MEKKHRGIHLISTSINSYQHCTTVQPFHHGSPMDCNSRQAPQEESDGASTSTTSLELFLLLGLQRWNVERQLSQKIHDFDLREDPYETKRALKKLCVLQIWLEKVTWFFTKIRPKTNSFFEASRPFKAKYYPFSTLASWLHPVWTDLPCSPTTPPHGRLSFRTVPIFSQLVKKASKNVVLFSSDHSHCQCCLLSLTFFSHFKSQVGKDVNSCLFCQIINQVRSCPAIYYLLLKFSVGILSLKSYTNKLQQPSIGPCLHTGSQVDSEG